MNEGMKNEEVFVELLGNKYTRAILSLTSSMECSALQLCQELNIPLATVYRKLRLLENNGLIKHVKTIIHLSGNEEKYYRCAVNEVKMSFHKGILSVSMNMDECNERIVRLWSRISPTE